MTAIPHREPAPPAAAAPRDGRLGAINGLRGIAILWVIYHHLFANRTASGFHALTVGGHLFPVFAPLSNGWQGVSLFFVLSGFVLHLPYAAGTRKLTGRADISQFYKRRYFRLFPLFYLNCVISLTFFVHPEIDVLRALRETALLLTATFPFDPAQYFPRVNWVLWSLGIEVWFSVLMPLLIVARDRFGIRRMVVASLILACAMRVLAVHQGWGNVVKDSVLARLDDFVLGMAAAEWYVRGGPAKRYLPWMLGGGAVLLYSGFMIWDMAWMHLWPVSWIAFTGIFSNVGFFLVVSAAVQLDRGALYRVLTDRFLQICGMMCYSLYVWHGIVKVGVFGKIEVDEYRPFMLGTYLVLTAAISLFTYRYVEFRQVADWRKLFRGEGGAARREGTAVASAPGK